MSMLNWAKKEIEIACIKERGEYPNTATGATEWDYGCACYLGALEAFEVLCKQGHTGMSIGFTKQILDRLLEGKPLTPIEDTEDTWNFLYTDDAGGKHYQCKRMSSLFKDVAEDGTVTYSDINRCYCVNEDNPYGSWHNGFVNRLYSEMYPLTLPYMPSNKADEIVCKEFLTDPKNGDFDTLAILYINRANGDRVEVNRYFKDGDTSFIEITLEEYRERMDMDKIRKEALQNEI